MFFVELESDTVSSLVGLKKNMPHFGKTSYCMVCLIFFVYSVIAFYGAVIAYFFENKTINCMLLCAVHGRSNRQT